MVIKFFVNSVSATSTNGGSVSFFNTTHVQYNKCHGFLGIDTFTYTICDIQVIAASDLCTSAFVYVNVVNYPPVHVTVPKGLPSFIDVLVYDYDSKF